MYAVTGATGHLGRLVIQELLATVPAGEIVAVARDPGKAADLAARGVQVRHADYNRSDTLKTALEGVTRVLLISSSEVGGRLPQHRAVLEAARAAGVELFAYTSILHADGSPLMLAREHQETEAAIAESGLPAVLLRNGWYTENYLLALQPILENGAILGAVGEGRISPAARADYAAAAARALTGEGQAGRVYELAGDESFTLPGFAAELSRQAGREIVYRDLSEGDYRAALEATGLPPDFAEVVADADAHAAKGALFDDGRALSRLIGRPTTPVAQTIAAALEAGRGG